MLQELVDQLSKYLSGDQTLAQLSQWVSTIDWDEGGLAVDLRPLMGECELLVTEIEEGMRESSELIEFASAVIAAMYPMQELIFGSVNTTVTSSPSVFAEAGRVEYVTREMVFG